MPESNAGNAAVKYTETSEVFRLGFSDFMNGIKDPKSLPALCYAKIPGVGWRPHPATSTFHGFDVLPEPKSVGVPRAQSGNVENWYHSKYNQPSEVSTFYVRNAIVTAGSARRPKSSPFYFAGEKIGFHDGAGCLLLPNKGVFEGSFSMQDGQRYLPSTYFSVEDGRLVRHLEPTIAARPQRLLGTHYFLGNFLPHWGHFLLDGISRLWLLKLLDEDIRRQMKFICFDVEFPNWAWALLEPFGINRENVIFSKQDISVENLIVPLDSYRTHLTANPLYQPVLNDIKDYYAPQAKPHRKIFLSRKFQQARQMENESELEAFFSDLGFEIVVPEKQSVKEQVALAAEASVLAGAAGSGMYLAGFQSPGTKSLFFGPRTFFLFDDFLLAALGARHAGFVLGSSFDVENKLESKWHVNFDDSLKTYIRNFI